jgi:hypothetical protein
MPTLSQVSNNARPGSPDQCEFHRAQTEIPTQAQQTGLNGAPGTRIFSSATSLPNLRTIAAARTSSFYFTMNSAFSQELPGKCLPIISSFWFGDSQRAG